MLSVLEIIQKTSEFFAGKGVESPRLNAELLIGHALGLKRMQLYLQFERLLTEPELEKIRPLVRRRASREPLQYIIGSTDFHGLKLKVDRRALIPRPETELLVEIVIATCGTPPGQILDLGTGSGAIALALAAAFPSSAVTAVDISPEALSLARENATDNAMLERTRWIQSSWFEALDQNSRFDLIVANPPYLSAEETAETAPEVRAHEPSSALASGENGLADLRSIISKARAHLVPGGLLALETGIEQHAVLIPFAQEHGFIRLESRQDLTRRDRFLLAWNGF